MVFGLLMKTQLIDREMEKQFAPYELSVKLKELGFNEECFGYYNAKGSIRYSGQIEPLGLDTEEMSNDILNSKYCSAPLWQQAFDFFREKGYPSWVYESSNRYWYKIVDKYWWHGNTYDDKVLTYESARLACLEKLIELTTPSIRG